MGQITHVAVRLGEIRRRDFRRMLVVSVAAHLAIFVVMTFNPPSSVIALPGVVSVVLVAAPPGPVPRAVPAPPPPKPVTKKVVLPKEPATPKPKAKAVVKKAPPQPQPVEVERDLSDVLADLRADAGEKAPEPAKTAAVALATAGTGGLGRPVSPEVAAWQKKAKIHVRRAWVLPPAFRTQALEAHVQVNLDAAGIVLGAPRIVRRSGNPWYDEGVVRAIQKASPLPAPPEADVWPFVFVPGDSY
jgi:TonB family protein